MKSERMPIHFGYAHATPPPLQSCSFQVKVPLQSPLTVRNNAVCAPAIIPSELRAGSQQGVAGADYYLLVTAQSGASCGGSSGDDSAYASSSSAALAWAMACDYSLDPVAFGRPILGVINLCPGAVTQALAAAQQASPASSPSAPGGKVSKHGLA